MATPKTLRRDLENLCREAKSKGKRDLSHAVAEAIIAHAERGNRLPIHMVELVGIAGEGFIASALPAYLGAINTRVVRRTAKRIFREALEDYLTNGKTWSRSDPAFGDSRNEWFDQHYPQVAERLRDRLASEMRVADANRKSFWDRYGVPFAIAATFVLAVAGWLLTHFKII